MSKLVQLVHQVGSKGRSKLVQLVQPVYKGGRTESTTPPSWFNRFSKLVQQAAGPALLSAAGPTAFPCAEPVEPAWTDQDATNTARGALECAAVEPTPDCPFNRGPLPTEQEEP